ncbi:uncharacterized protein PV09_01171 [Verruconis gallopava]|uniref:Uncharacterized protein n=1 Tax=Verruconis gallopava TaxID=253628 RepID=A0A0D2BAA0_9PEZI|nr:uncharacterized protein PV09_01171 [Verruconis gallopava]KIW08244.1 hypothetical protein PV09_01171 [Verruconis gallopava]
MLWACTVVHDQIMLEKWNRNTMPEPWTSIRFQSSFLRAYLQVLFPCTFPLRILKKWFSPRGFCLYDMTLRKQREGLTLDKPGHKYVFVSLGLCYIITKKIRYLRFPVRV